MGTFVGCLGRNSRDAVSRAFSLRKRPLLRREQRFSRCSFHKGYYRDATKRFASLLFSASKAKQFGYCTLLSLVCLGDEPFNEALCPLVQGADWLLCEAFCLAADSERFKPYENHHSTAADAGRLAATLGVRHLLLYHTEDETLPTRLQRRSCPIL